MTRDKTMWLVIAGVVMLLLKLAAIGPAAVWSWWVVVAPFAIAAVWWQIADSTGITQRAAVARQDERVKRRREERMDALGLRPGKSGFSASRTGGDSVAPAHRSGFASTRAPDDKAARRGG
jgi:small Trp-rich protein